MNPPSCKCTAGFSGANCDTGTLVCSRVIFHYLRSVAVVDNEFCPGNCSNQGICNVSTSVCDCSADQGLCVRPLRGEYTDMAL